MSDFETRVGMARLNRDLAEFWIEQYDYHAIEIHRSTSVDFESRIIRAVNSLYRQRDECLPVIRGAELREVFSDES